MTPTQRQVHVASELVAVAVIAPFLLAVSKRPELSDADRKGLRAVAVATLLVDGWLLARWLK